MIEVHLLRRRLMQLMVETDTIACVKAAFVSNLARFSRLQFTFDNAGGDHLAVLLCPWRQTPGPCHWHHRSYSERLRQRLGRSCCEAAHQMGVGAEWQYGQPCIVPLKDPGSRVLLQFCVAKMPQTALLPGGPATSSRPTRLANVPVLLVGTAHVQMLTMHIQHVQMQ